MNNNTNFVQKIIYPAIVNKGCELIEVIVPDLDIDIAARELDNAIGIASYLAQSKVDTLFDSNEEIPSASVWSHYRILDLYKYGEELIGIEVETNSCL